MGTGSAPGEPDRSVSPSLRYIGYTSSRGQLPTRSSTGTTTGYDVYQSRRGVCRDFAHLGVMFCRALSIPARYVCGYLPDINVPVNPEPMDFHAWCEAYLGGAWRTFDARHNRPRIGRVVIAHGRDAIDTAILTSYGASILTGMTVWANERPDLTLLDEQKAQRGAT